MRHQLSVLLTALILAVLPSPVAAAGGDPGDLDALGWLAGCWQGRGGGFFEPPAAPFSWQPETVEVLDSGTLALSTGPVRDAGGKLISRFTSIWRLEAPGQWRIVFDKGNRVCEEPASP